MKAEDGELKREMQTNAEKCRQMQVPTITRQERSQKHQQMKDSSTTICRCEEYSVKVRETARQTVKTGEELKNGKFKKCFM